MTTNKMTSTVVFDTIKSLTNDTLTAFEQRELTLKEMSISEVYPVIEDIANRLISGPVDEDARYLLIKDIQWVQSQLFLRKTLKKKTEILSKSKKTIQKIESIVVCHSTRQGLESLDDKVEIGEKTKLENLINNLEDAIKQKNYSVMKELNEVIQTKFAQLMQTSDNQTSENTSKIKEPQDNNDVIDIDIEYFIED